MPPGTAQTPPQHLAYNVCVEARYEGPRSHPDPSGSHPAWGFTQGSDDATRRDVWDVTFEMTLDTPLEPWPEAKDGTSEGKDGL